MRKRHLALGIVCMLVIGLVGPLASPSVAASGGARIQRGLLDRLRSGRLDTFVVEFAARADLRAAARIEGWAARGRAVHRGLTSVADRSQVRAAAVVRATPAPVPSPSGSRT